MNDSYETDRRLFLTQLCAVAATAALIGSTLKAEHASGRKRKKTRRIRTTCSWLGRRPSSSLISRCSMVSIRRKAIIHLRTGIR